MRDGRPGKTPRYARGARVAAWRLWLWPRLALTMAAVASAAHVVVADDYLGSPLPVGTTVDLSVSTVGPIRDVAVADQTYIAVEDQGLWVMQGDGKTIEKVNAPAQTVVALATDGGQFYIGADEGLFAGRAGAWETQVGDMISALCVQADPPLYLAGAHHGMWRSEDGQHWTAVPFPDALVLSCAIAGTHAYAGTSAGMFRSTDKGQTWTAASEGLRIRYTAAVAVDGNTVYAATDGSGLYVSTDDAATWSLVTAAPSSLQDLAVTNGVISVVSQETLQHSSDAGATWTSTESGGIVKLKAATLMSSVGAAQ